MNEIWKPIKNFEGYYEISNLGNVRSVDRFLKQKDHLIFRKSCLKKTRIDANGYVTVTLCKNRKSITKYIHKLLADAFLPNPENKPYIDHINTIKTDNSLSNLRWVTAKENSNNPITIQHFIQDASNKNSIHERLITRKQNHAKTGPKTIYQYTLFGKFVKEHFSIAEASRYINGSPSYIRKHLNSNKIVYGFIWTDIQR